MAVGCLGSENCSAWWNGGAMGHEMVMFGWMAVPWVVECRAVGRCRGSRNDGGWWDGAMCSKRRRAVGRRRGSRNGGVWWDGGAMGRVCFFFSKNTIILLTCEKQCMETHGFGEAGRGAKRKRCGFALFSRKTNRDKKRQTTHEHMWFRTGRARSK